MSKPKKIESEIQRAWKTSANVVNPLLTPEQDAKIAAVYRQEPRLFIEPYISIRNKRGQIIPLKFNRPQRIVYDLICRLREANRPVRLIILKARQVGISTMIASLIYTVARFWPRSDGRLISFERDSADNIYRMIELMHDGLPEEIKPPEVRKTTNLIVLGNKDPGTRAKHPGLMSSIQTGTARNINVGRGSTYRALHLCLVPGTPVLVGDGQVKPVEAVRVGDRVITHDGNHTTVREIRPMGTSARTVRITPWLGESIEITDNHPVWTRRGWIAAGDLALDDQVSMPLRPISEPGETGGFEIRGRGSNGNKNRRHASGCLPIDEDTGFLVGYYLAEGCVIYNTVKGVKRPSAVTFARDVDETAYMARIVEKVAPFVNSRKQYRHKNSRTVSDTLYSAGLAEWLATDFGAGDAKHVPDWVFHAGKAFCRGLLAGYLSGDGSKTAKGTLLVRSVRASLATQARDLAASLGYGWGSLARNPAGRRYGRNCKECWTVSWHGEAYRRLSELVGVSPAPAARSVSPRYEIDATHVWFPIKALEPRTASVVWDLEVEHADHSFRTLSFAVSNTEFAYWARASETLRSLMQTVPREPDTFAFIESSSLGAGGFFHKEFLRARKGQSEWTPVFLPFWLMDEYEDHLTPEEEQEVITNADAYEKSLKDKFKNITWGHVSWRRKTMSEKCHGSKIAFDLEYAPTVDEAFAAQGQTLFDLRAVTWYEENTVRPGRTGDIVVRGDRTPFPDFIDNPRGALTIWKRPEPGEVYVIGSDAAMGKKEEIDDDDTSPLDEGIDDAGDRDYCAAVVLNSKLEQVAEYRSRIVDPYSFGDILASLGMFYNTALIMPETTPGGNSAGFGVLYRLKEMHYPNLGRWEWIDKVETRPSNYYGFEINAKTKTHIIGMMQREIMRGAGMLFTRSPLKEAAKPRLIIRSKELCNELTTFVQIRGGGGVGAKSGTHDDLVIALGLALKGHQQMGGLIPHNSKLAESHSVINGQDDDGEASPQDWMYL